MSANSQPKQPFTVSLEFDTSPTFGVLYRRMKASMEEREAALMLTNPICPVLFREVRDLKNMMQLLRSAFEKTLAQWEPREAKRAGDATR